MAEPEMVFYRGMPNGEANGKTPCSSNVVTEPSIMPSNNPLSLFYAYLLTGQHIMLPRVSGKTPTKTFCRR